MSGASGLPPRAAAPSPGTAGPSPTGEDGHRVTIRRARRDDVAPIVRLLADDPLGARRESDVSPLPSGYLDAFDAIDRDPNQVLLVGDREGAIVAVLQVTLTPHLTYRGGWRATIEGVRVSSRLRSGGLGRRLLEHAIGVARERGCHLVQLTTDKARPEALRFYERLGFVASHEGMKLHLHAPPSAGAAAAAATAPDGAAGSG